MHKNKGYEIINAVMLENGRGFALGHHPTAPSPYACTLGQFVPKQPAPAADPRRSSILFTHPHMNRMEEIQK